jgi:uncharacterized protein YggL (DUF469 family)
MIAMSSACPIYGFEFVYHLRDGLSEDASNRVWRSFVETVECHGLSAGGGGDIHWRHVITRDGGQATDADRVVLLAWAEACDEITDASAGPLIDLEGEGA